MKLAPIVITDMGMGNLNSVKRAMERVGMPSTITSSASAIESADKIILPGVGHFGKAMAALESLGLRDALDEAVLVKRKPVLGICLGMELMAARSDEGNAEGLGWLDARAVKFCFDDKLHHKVPHMGWNTLAANRDSILLKGLENAEFYFAHSFYLKLDNEQDASAHTTYETVFPSAIERDNIFGVQFHPEKSHAAGLDILRNFAAI
jgi:glutamine amidotransferase